MTAVPKIKFIYHNLMNIDLLEREADKWGLKGYYPISIFPIEKSIVIALVKEDHESIHTIIGDEKK